MVMNNKIKASVEEQKAVYVFFPILDWTAARTVVQMLAMDRASVV